MCLTRILRDNLAILINEEFGPAHFNLGNAYLSLEKYHKAIEHFDLCMKHDGDDAMALCYIGEAYEQLNELDLSKHYYKKSIALEPMLPEAWLGLGIVEDLLGSTKEGIVLIQKALDYDPENAGIYHVLAGAYEKIEATEEANYHYLKSLELGPTDEEALNDYMAFLSSSSLSTAQHFILEFLDKHPQHIQAHFNSCSTISRATTSACISAFDSCNSAPTIRHSVPRSTTLFCGLCRRVDVELYFGA